MSEIWNSMLVQINEQLPLATGMAVACRMVPIALLLPLGNSGMGWKTKVALAALLTILITPLHQETGLVTTDNQVIPPWEFLFSEAITGLAIGTAMLFIVEALLLGGQWLGMTGGVPLKTTSNSEIGNTSIGLLVNLITCATLLTLGLHRYLLTAILDSYQWLPPGNLSMTQTPAVWFDQAAVVATWSFTLALRIAMPVMIIMVTVNLTLGWISRHSPTLNHFVIGIPLNTLVLLGAAMLTLGSTMLTLQTEIESALDLLGVL